MHSVNALDLAERVRDGHSQLLQEAISLQAWWYGFGTATTIPFEVLSQRILDLRQRIQVHFRDEELLDHDEGVDDLPVPSNERAVLLADLDQLILRLRVCQPGMDCWADAERAMERFFQKLENHERREVSSLPME